jgi:hypothetical protein
MFPEEGGEMKVGWRCDCGETYTQDEKHDCYLRQSVKLGPCTKCGDYVKPCRCSLEAEVKALKAELNDKCLLCEASTDARSWQAENEALREENERLRAADDRAHRLIDYLAERVG